jgi:hypothetical protein
MVPVTHPTLIENFIYGKKR